MSYLPYTLLNPAKISSQQAESLTKLNVSCKFKSQHILFPKNMQNHTVSCFHYSLVKNAVLNFIFCKRRNSNCL